jgi:hypothetical protein
MKLTETDNVFSTQDSNMHGKLRRQLAPGVCTPSATIPSLPRSREERLTTDLVFREKQPHLRGGR